MDPNPYSPPNHWLTPKEAPPVVIKLMFGASLTIGAAMGLAGSYEMMPFPAIGGLLWLTVGMIGINGGMKDVRLGTATFICGLMLFSLCMGVSNLFIRWFGKNWIETDGQRLGLTLAAGILSGLGVGVLGLIILTASLVLPKK